MKRVMEVLLVCMCSLCFIGCSNVKTDKSYSFEVETGDTIKVTLETQNGYNMTNESPMTFTKKEADYEAKGVFMVEDNYTQVVNQITSDSFSGKLLEEGETVEGNDYLFFMEDMGQNTQYSFVLHIGDSDTYYMMSTLADRDLFEKNFDALTFEVE